MALLTDGTQPITHLDRHGRSYHITFAASLLLSVLLVIALWPQVSHGTLLAWMLALWLVQGGRVLYARSYLRRRIECPKEHRRWLGGFMLGAMVAGACWSLTFFSFGLHQFDPAVVLLVFAVAGVTAYGGATMAFVFPVAVAFELAAILPMSTWLFLQGSRIHLFMGAAVLLYLGMRYLRLRQASALTSKVRSLGAENEAMSDSLRQLKSLERENAMFRNLFETIADPAVVHDMREDARIVYANAAACRHFGVDREAALTLHPADFDVKLDPEKLEIVLNALEQNGKIVFETVHRNTSGDELPVEVTLSRFDYEGSYLCVSFIRNISARLAVEKRVRELEVAAVRDEGNRRMARYLDNAPGYFFTLVHRPDGSYAMPFASRGIQETFGIEPADVEHDIDALAAVAHPDDVEMAFRATEESGRNLTPYHVEYRILHPQKGERWIECRSMPQREADGSTVWHGFMHDITERKCMEAELLRRENEFRALAENAPDPIYRYDRDCRRIYINPAVEKLTGRALPELLGKSPVEAVPVPDVNAVEVQRVIQRVLDTGEPGELEVDFIAANGQRAIILNSLVPELAADGTVQTVLCIGRDITAHKLMEEVLVRSEAEYRTLAANLPVAVIRYDAEQRRRYVNPAAERMLRGNTAELLGLVPGGGGVPATPAMIDYYRGRMAEVAATGETREFEFALDALPEDGQAQYEVRMVPEYGEDGTVAGTLAIWFDITARKQLSGQLQESQERYLQIFDNAQEGMFLLDVTEDLRFRVLEANSAFARLVGITHAGMLGKFIEDILLPETAQKVAAKYRRCVDSGGVLREEQELLLPVGLHTYDTTLVPVRNEAGRVYRLVGISSDITERKGMEEELRLKERVLDQAREGVYLIDDHARFVYVNDEACRALGYSREELLGMGVQDIDHAYSVEDSNAVGRRSQEEGSFAFETQHRRRDGSLFPVEIQASALEYQGKHLGLALARDISERKQAERQLKETLEFSEGVINAIPDLLFEVDGEGRYLNIWAQNQELLAAQKELLLGRTINEMLEPEAAAATMSAIGEADEKGLSLGKTICLSLPHGKCWFELSVSRKSCGDSAAHFLVLSRDITERKAIEMAFRDSENMLQEAQRIAHVGSWDVDMVNDRLTWSDEIFRIWEIDKTKFKADFAAFLETVHPEDRERVNRVYYEAVANHTLYEVEHRLLFPDGRIKHILERGEPQYDDQGTPVRFIGTSLDITERKRAEAALQQSEMKFRTLYDSTGDAVMLLDEQGFFDCNASALKIFGCATREEFCVKHPADLSPPVQPCGTDSRTLANRHIEQALEEGCHRFEWVHWHAVSNEVFPAEVLLSSMVLDGKPVLQATVRDIAERKRAEAALAAREREFRSLAGNLPDNIARFDPEGRYLYVNPVHERTLGMKAADLVGQSIPDSHEHVKAGVRQVAATGLAISAVRQAVMVDGVEELHDVSLVPEFDAAGKVVSVLGMGRDMTAIYRMQETIAAREAEFRGLAENMPDSVVRWDSEGRYTYINPTLERALGASLGEIAGKRPSEAFPDRRFEPLEIAIGKLVASGGGAVCVPQPVPAGNGQMAFHEVSLVVERNAAGEVTGVLGIGRDVTERKRMEEAIAAREEEFRSLAENTPDNIARWDREGRIRYSNPIHQRTLGKAAAEMIGKTHGELFPDGRFAEFDAVMARIVASGEGAVLERVLVPGENGEMRRHEVKLVPEFDADGKVIGVLGLGRDMTDIYRMQEAIAAREQEFRSLAESAPDNIVRYDREGRCRYLNERLLRHLGLASMDEVVGKRPGEVWPDGRFAELEEAAARVVASGERAELEVTEPDGKGGWLYHLISVVAERNEQGDIVGSLAFGRNITQLRSTERLMQMIGDHLPGAVTHYRLRSDLSGELLYASQGLKELFGISKEALADGIGPMIALIHPDDLPKAVAEQEHAASTLTTAVSEFRVNHPEKGEIWVQQITTPMPESEASQLWYSLMFDITERKRLEIAIAAREAEFRSLAENLPDAIFRYDREGRRLFVNRTVEEVTGKSRESLVGKSAVEAMLNPSIDAVRAHQLVMEVIQTGERRDFETSFIA
ncbi:MAG TPA: PAS domain S-box protein, partial [Gallionella sp.]|nr:PAS domain S-box protein [Gallionella sp.]